MDTSYGQTPTRCLTKGRHCKSDDGSGRSGEELMKRLGMEREEVAQLNNRAGMHKLVGTQTFNQAWVKNLKRK